ncbi:carbohydrate-binding family 9-like protein [Chitinophaga barathri]|uniref:Carbohydrate-binding family 9-like protein n=2 Tax=Chitinophaga barathri TaxID=1647451 RepID=A0A3N4M561_9BACT|nr:carbohydrate-binding family 9-like protein [Chitinophaga barathri]
MLALLLAVVPMSQAQTFSANFQSYNETPRHYVCYQAPDSIRIDGIPNERAWQKAPWTEDFMDIEGKNKPAPLHRTRVKMLWNSRYLYILAELEEPDVWARLHQHDTIIFHDNDFEVFIDPDGDTHQYYEIEINALNTVMDLFMVKPYRNGSAAMLNWDTKGLRTAVHINGTINKPGDKDRSWTVEMAIPFRALSFFARGNATPQDGSQWRINFSRVQWQTDIGNGQYIKKPNTPEYNWVWSPQGIINMHAPERWGYLQFSTSAESPVPFKEPETAAARKVLWEIYYRQQQYRREHRQYAKDAATLGLTELPLSPVIEATSSQFTAVVKDAGFETIINQEGKITSRHE